MLVSQQLTDLLKKLLSSSLRATEDTRVVGSAAISYAKSANESRIFSTQAKEYSTLFNNIIDHSVPDNADRCAKMLSNRQLVRPD